MTPGIETFSMWSYGLAAVCHFVLAAFLVSRRIGHSRPAQHDQVVVAMALAAAITVIWSVFGFVAAVGASPSWVSAELGSLLDALLYGAWYAVPLSLMYFSPDRTKVIVQLVVASTAAIVLALTVAGLLLSSPSPWLARTSGYISLGLSVFGLLLLEQMYRNVAVDSRWHIKPLVVGLGATFLFDLYFYSSALLFGHVDTTAFAVRGFAYALMAPLVTVTLLRAGSRRLKVAMSQHAAFHTTTLVATGTYLLLASAAGYYVRYWGGSWGGALQLALVFAALVLLALLMLSRTAQARMRVLVGKHFFSYRYDYREEWLRFTAAMTAEDAATPLGLRVIRGLADMVESPAGSLWLSDMHLHSYVQSARWNLPESQAVEPEKSDLIKFISASGWLINLEEYRQSPVRYQDLKLPQWLVETPNAWLVVPLKAAAEPIGFVILATSRTPIDINWEVNDLLKTAGSQAASYLAQMQVTEALLEVRKFDAFNRMSAFVVHDLKNIVSQLSLLVRNAEKHANNPEFQSDMLLTVSHSVERMKQLMLQLRGGAIPTSSQRSVGLAAVASRVHSAKQRQFPALRLNVTAQPSTRGHEERIERVVGHLVQNAIDATPADGEVWIEVGCEEDTAVIEVGDTGRGMSEEFQRNELFKPFRTTREEGTGIGAYESYQYIKELGGNIVVTSKLNAGSCFRVILPVAGSGYDEDAAKGKG